MGGMDTGYIVAHLLTLLIQITRYAPEHRSHPKTQYKNVYIISINSVVYSVAYKVIMLIEQVVETVYITLLLIPGVNARGLII